MDRDGGGIVLARRVEDPPGKRRGWPSTEIRPAFSLALGTLASALRFIRWRLFSFDLLVSLARWLPPSSLGRISWPRDPVFDLGFAVGSSFRSLGLGGRSVPGGTLAYVLPEDSEREIWGDDGDCGQSAAASLLSGIAVADLARFTGGVGREIPGRQA